MDVSTWGRFDFTQRELPTLEDWLEDNLAWNLTILDAVVLHSRLNVEIKLMV